MIENREIRAVKTGNDVAWFEFRELCDGPRSQNDYIELGKIFGAILLANVEQMNVTMTTWRAVSSTWWTSSTTATSSSSFPPKWN